jgi:hypothetical protein
MVAADAVIIEVLSFTTPRCDTSSKARNLQLCQRRFGDLPASGVLDNTAGVFTRFVRIACPR